jgi:hypothetical protein
VSSILEALRKIEAAEPPGIHARPAPTGEGRPRHRAAAGLVVAFAAGVALAFWWLAAERPTEPSSPAVPARPPRAPTAALARPAPPPPLAQAAALPVAPPAPAPGVGEAPRGHVALAAPPAVTAAGPSRQPPREPAARLEVVPAAALPPPAALPRVQVGFLVYSRVPERRSVTVSIDGAGLVTLHEGDSFAGVEVSRILPDRVQLRHEGKVFVAEPRD